jgi:hypothetical protein
MSRLIFKYGPALYVVDLIPPLETSRNRSLLVQIKMLTFLRRVRNKLFRFPPTKSAPSTFKPTTLSTESVTFKVAIQNFDDRLSFILNTPERGITEHEVDELENEARRLSRTSSELHRKFITSCGNEGFWEVLEARRSVEERLKESREMMVKWNAKLRELRENRV